MTLVEDRIEVIPELLLHEAQAILEESMTR